MHDLEELDAFDSDLMNYIREKKHIMLLYSDPDDYKYVASQFIAGGLKSGECCILAVSSYPREEIIADLQALEIETEMHLQQGSLILMDVNERYSGKKGFDPEKTSAEWIEILDGLMEKGFPRLRAVGEESFTANVERGCEKLINYENVLNRDIFPHYPILALCVYDKARYSSETIKSAIQSHPMLIHGRTVYKNNIYYIPPEIYFSGATGATEVEYWLSNMENNNLLAQKIVKNEEKFSTIFNKSHDAFFVHELMPDRTCFIEVNDPACRLLGYSREELLKLQISDVTTSPRDSFQERVERLCRGEALLFETVFITKDGNTFPVEVNINPFIINGNNFAFSAVRDITAQKKAEIDYKAAVEATNDGIWEYNLKTGAFKYSQHWAAMLGYRMGEVAGDQCFCQNNVHPEDRERFEKAFNSYLNGERDRYEIEFRLRCRDGSYKWIYSRGKTIERDSEGNPLRMLGAHTDISERIRLEQLIVQSEKMLSIGGLAAGMAHEINNPLAGILGNVQNIRNRIFRDTPANISTARECDVSLLKIREYLERRNIPKMFDGIHEAGTRAAKIVANMLNFSRKSGDKHDYHDLAELLDTSIELASTDYNLERYFDFRMIDIVREYSRGVPRLFCDGNEIQQVFLNLLRNGAEAMSEKDYDSDSPRFICRTRKNERSIIVEIEDNGPGMNDRTMTKIFEPFYTTKAVGNGTGLGLSVSYFIITEQHHGSMEVHSVPGGGTRFTLSFPLNRS